MATRRLNPVTVAWDSPGLMHLYGSQPQYLGGQEGAEGMNPTPVNNPWLMAGGLKASGQLTPQAMKDYLASQEYGADARLNQDNTITYTPVAPVDGFDLGEMLAPMALGGFAFGLGGLANAAGGASAMSPAALEAAALTGSGVTGGAAASQALLGNLGFAGLSGAGLAESGGGMWDWLDSLDIPDIDWNSAPTGGSMDAVPPWSGDVLRDLSQLPPATNLQDYITKMDANPATRAMLNAEIGGWGDAAGKITLKDLLGSAGSARNALSLLNQIPGFAPQEGRGGILGSILGDPLGAAFNATPFLLAMYQANKQANDLDGVLSKINGEGYTRAVLNPYDLQTGLGRTALEQDLNNRGVSGSSFGYQSLGNYDYMRDLGRGDLASKGIMASAGLEGNLINQRNTNTNLLLGAGLNASGRLFSPQRDPFNLNMYRELGLV